MRNTAGAGRGAVAAAAALSFAMFAFVTAELLPVGLLTVMADDLGRSRSDVGLLVTGYAVVVVLASFPLARLTSRFPRRSVLAVTLAVFAASSVLTALAGSYELVLLARLVTALAQALFWSVVVAAAAGLFPPGVRGRVAARLQIGSALAPVMGVPAGTWLGQQVGWRVPFAVLGVVVLLVGLTVLRLLPAVPAAEAGAARGAAPDARRYAVLMLVLAVTVTGAFTAYTYITPFLLDVTGFDEGSLAPLLLVSGLSGVVSAALIGPLLDRYPVGAVTLPVALMATALVVLHLGARNAAVAVLALVLFGLAISGLAGATSAATLHLAPAGTDTAGAGTSAAFNVGIASGSALGGALVAGTGVAAVAPVGAAFAAAGLVLTVTLLIRRRGRPGPTTSARAA